jgi:hypothetical protein
MGARAGGAHRGHEHGRRGGDRGRPRPLEGHRTVPAGGLRLPAAAPLSRVPRGAPGAVGHHGAPVRPVHRLLVERQGVRLGAAAAGPGRGGRGPGGWGRRPLPHHGGWLLPPGGAGHRAVPSLRPGPAGHEHRRGGGVRAARAGGRGAGAAAGGGRDVRRLPPVHPGPRRPRGGHVHAHGAGPGGARAGGGGPGERPRDGHHQERRGRGEGHRGRLRHGGAGGEHQGLHGAHPGRLWRHRSDLLHHGHRTRLHPRERGRRPARPGRAGAGDHRAGGRTGAGRAQQCVRPSAATTAAC